MANTYSTSTGVLILDKVTPMIMALFGAFALDPTTPGNGEVYIASTPEDEPHWGKVNDRVAALRSDLGVELPDDTSEGIAMELFALAEHFGINDPGLFQLLDHHEFTEDEDADLQVLFDLAQWFDDGHGLKAIKFEGSWRCDKPQLFEFGGAGDFIGRHISVRSSSATAIVLGAELDAAIEIGNLDGVATRFVTQINGILAGLTDGAIADRVRVKLGRSLVDAYGKLEEGSPAWLRATFDTEHPDHPRSAWRSEVANDDTLLGYWEWVFHSIEGAAV
ncbi:MULTISPECIES: hypothetical protein [unclassified Cupriavidus]|jgi:hypothetical protein|uniref:hypothetical protein n=1 Tax=unclassified Cupriavidus TaxID=2640874 RepID=UPI0010F9E3FB|nr:MULTISPECIES: hypothetical protein [unclassified Cupriavidus]QWE98138.1 hypothetical protein KLP38_28455 [Cupriavidus sp. EM10]